MKINLDTIEYWDAKGEWYVPAKELSSYQGYMLARVHALEAALQEGLDRLEQNHTERDFCPDDDHEWMNKVLNLLPQSVGIVRR